MPKTRRTSQIAQSGQSDNLRVWWIVAGLGLLILLTYGHTLRFGFTNWDDDTNITQNPYIVARPSLTNLLHLWLQPYATLYIPLTYTLFAIEWWLGDGKPVVFHATNLILHFGATIVVFWMIRQLLGAQRSEELQRKPPPISPFAVDFSAAVGAALFAVHPIQVEVASWVTAQKDLLSGLFVLGALALWLARPLEPQAEKPWWSQMPRAWRHDLLPIVCFCAALLAKPSAVVAPLLVLAVPIFLGRRNVSHGLFHLARLVPWFAIATLWTLITARVQPITEELKVATPWPQRLLVAADSLVFYVRHILWPQTLLPVYGRTPTSIAFSWIQLTLAVALLAAIGIVFWRKGIPAVAVAWFAAGIFPTLGFQPFRFQAYSTVADRYAYLSMAGVALGVGYVMLRMSAPAARWRAAQVFAAGVIALCAWWSSHQTRIWASSYTLWTHTVGRGIAQAEVFNNLGNAYLEMGKPQEALAAFRRALECNPNHPETNNNVGNLLLDAGQTTQAITHFERALANRQNYAVGYSNLGNALFAAGRRQEALAAYRRAYELNSRHPDIVMNYALALLKERQFSEALKILEPFVQERPRIGRGWLLYGLAQRGLGNIQSARAALQRAQALDPSLAAQVGQFLSQPNPGR
ncbi:MAG: tetratricopeptide repeat protein [Candidatus Hydrogenedentota bacterium]|nr:MAG: tetratricopeptide repeat protein [Candidatus Hydrogenedentota bacterium]